MPDLTEKNAINTFLLFSPSLSPDLFMFLDLCLHSLAFIRGDAGCCSTRTSGISIYSILERARASAAFRVISVRAKSSTFAVSFFFGGGILEGDAYSVAKRTTSPRVNVCLERKQLRHALDVALRRCSPGTDLQIADMPVKIVFYQRFEFYILQNGCDIQK